nr:acetyl-CoA carboxylase biotin carboxyl carrier protein subunit [Propionibacterium sp.]
GPPPAASGPAASGTAASGPVASGPAASGGRADRMTAPMPGVLLELRIRVGDRVARGQTVMILEAMKMKNELKAPRDGVVAEVYAVEGQQVRYGEALLRFEEGG